MDFETAVRDLTRDVEQAYWELYYAYRDLDVKSRAREASLKTWEYRKRRLDSGLSRPDDEALARQALLYDKLGTREEVLHFDIPVDGAPSPLGRDA